MKSTAVRQWQGSNSRSAVPLPGRASDEENQPKAAGEFAKLPTLAIVPALRGYVVAPGRVRLTQKFVEGMTKYAELWPGKVIAVMLPDTAAESGNLDDREYDTDELSFEVRIASAGNMALVEALADADAVMLSTDHRLPKLTQWCKGKGKKTVFLTEYTFATRCQIIRANSRNPLLRLRRYIWEAQQELNTRRNVSVADALQCNGTPTFDAYRELNPNALLFFDSRITDSMLNNDAALRSRFRQLQNGAPIRLAFSGRLIAMKGADHLLDVARNLRAAGVPFRMEIFGDGPLRPVMEQQIRAGNLEQLVTLHGVLDFATELMPYIRDNVDLFVCCHRQGDPSCTYLETFACGVPIVGYGNEAFRGLTANRQIGWTTPMNKPALLANRITDLCSKPQEILAASLSALEFARQHTFEQEFDARISQIKKLFQID